MVALVILPTLVIISDTIRRDFQQPLQHVPNWRIIHLYKNQMYGDMDQSDLNDQTIPIKSPLHLYQLLLKIKPDVIQIPEPTAGYSRFTRISLKMVALWLPPLIYAKRTKTPLFFHMLENISLEIKYGRFFGWMMSKVLRWVIGSCFAVVILNDGAKAILQKCRINQTKIHRLLWGNWGVDLTEFKPDHSRRSHDPSVLFVGRVTTSKGIPWLLEAWRQVHTQVPNATLTIIGEGELADQCANTSGVQYLGRKLNKDLPLYFQKAWVTIAPSISTKIWAEQVGMVNLQSLACGTPVISTTSGAIPEYAPKESGAILVKEQDSHALATQLTNLIQNPDEVASRGAVGRKYAEDHYNSQSNVHTAFNWLKHQLS